MARSIEIKGVYTALVTLFTADGSEVDYEAFGKLVDAQIAGGVAGLVPIGTTGECPTLNKEEQQKVISFVIKRVAGRCQVIPGTGSNNTAVALAQTQWAKEAGADAVLVVNPYYNKPGQEGLYQHFKVIASVGVPIVLYNIPGRTNITMSPQTVARLYNDFESIVAIKEATGSLDIATEIASLCDIDIVSGDDSLTLPLISIGGKGVVSVFSNLDPEAVGKIVNPALAGDFPTAAKQHRHLFKIMKNMFIEANPQPIKLAMSKAGMCTTKCRQPLWDMAEDTTKVVLDILGEYGYENGGEPTAKKAKVDA